MSKILPIAPLLPKGRRLTPISEHRGPVLKLTEKEQSLVDSLQEELNNYQAEVYKIINLKLQAKTENMINYYNKVLVYLTIDIDQLTRQIKEIKANRYRIQLEDFQRKHK